MNSRILRRALGGSSVLVLLASGLARAQQYPSAPPPLHTSVDAQGVDLISDLPVINSPDVSIGQGIGALSYVRTFINNGWVDNQTGTISISGTTYTVSFGGASETFTNSGGVFTPNQGQGSTLSFDGAQTYTYTAADGTVVLFSTTIAGYQPAYVAARMTQATHPNGLVVTYTYQTIPNGSAVRLQSVNNNLGYQIKFSYQSDSNTNVSLWLTLASASGFNNGIVWCDPAANNCSGLLPGSPKWPSVTYTTTGSPVSQLVKQDAIGRKTYFNYDFDGRLLSIQSPLAATNPISYTYGSTLQIATASNGSGTWTYAPTSAGIVTVTVTDPLGHTRVVSSTTAQALVYSDQDGNGNTTHYIYLSTGQLQTLTLPLGNSVTYAYDGRGNVTTTTKVPAPQSPPLPNLTTHANFDPTCNFPAKCNQPNSTIDANGNETDYTYDTTYGELTKVDLPAPTTGSVRPETRYTYTPQNAWYLTSSSTTMEKRRPYRCWPARRAARRCPPTSCPGTADEVLQSFGYDGGSSTNSSNLALVSATTQAGTGTPSSPDTASYAMTYDPDGDLYTLRGAARRQPDHSVFL